MTRIPPTPSQRFMVIGVDLHVSNTHYGPAMLAISDKRLAALSLALRNLVQANCLSPGEAPSWTGKLGFA